MPRSRKTPEEPETDTRLTSILPGEYDVDNALLDRTVQDLNHLYTAKGLETARDLGEYVLREYFGDDYHAFKKRNKKHVSFQQLAKRDDLQPSASFLWYAVNIVPQLRMLPETIASALPLSHHRLLLHVQDEERRVKLAEEAVEKGLSRRALEEKIRRTKKAPEGAPRGRKPLPAFVRAFNAVRKAASTIEDLDEIKPEDLSTYGVAESIAYLEALESTIAKLEKVRAELCERVKTRVSG
jgi:hypothetical protein